MCVPSKQADIRQGRRTGMGVKSEGGELAAMGSEQLLLQARGWIERLVRAVLLCLSACDSGKHSNCAHTLHVVFLLSIWLQDMARHLMWRSMRRCSCCRSHGQWLSCRAMLRSMATRGKQHALARGPPASAQALILPVGYDSTLRRIETNIPLSWFLPVFDLCPEAESRHGLANS